MAEPTHAATTFTVNSTGDENDLDFPDGAFDGSTANTCDVTSAVAGNQCTLRAAIQQANVTTGADTIAFSIPGDGPHTISPTSVLPTITGEVTIDGYTQGDSTTGTTADDAVENTAPLTEDRTNAVLKIELDGSNAGTGSDKDGLTIACCPNGGPGRVVVRGLAINRFEGAGIALVPVAWPRIEGNFIGTNPAGDTDLGNGGGGIEARSSNNGTIGSTFQRMSLAQQRAGRNLISGNGGDGISFSNSNAYVVRSNLIGTTADGATPMPNTGDGVLIDGFGHTIGEEHLIVGGESTGAGNVIAHNGGRGVAVVSGTRNFIYENSIFSNGGLGIDLQGGTETNGVTQNDAQDSDLGANNLQNYPRLLTATTDGTTTTITGKLQSKPSQNYAIQFFSSTQADPSGFGEGQEYLGQKGNIYSSDRKTNVMTDRSGNVSFSFTDNQDLRGEFVTATAHFFGVVDGDVVTEGGGTSELSGAVQVTQGPPTFEGPTISDIANQTVDQDNDAGPIPFTVGDADSLAATLEVRGTSSNTALVPNANIAFGGTGENRTVTVTPAAGKSGTATIMVKVSDGTTEATDTFVLTVLDTAEPKVSGVFPTDAATGVSPTANVVATFSEAMDTSTINGGTFTLTKPDGSDADTNPDPVVGVVNYDSATKKATLDPTAALDYSTTYTATVTTGAMDLAGNQLDQDPNSLGNQSKTWSFTTAPPDTTAPRVSTATPTGTSVARGTNATATFSERMDPTTITTSTFKLFRCSSTTSTDCATQITNVTISRSTDRLKATLNPFGTSSTLLAGSTKFKVVLTTGAKDEAGNNLDQDASTSGSQQKVWYFTTGGS